jgi:hypothetical protein
MDQLFDLYQKKLWCFAIGKLYVIDPVFSINCGGLGAIFLSHHLFFVKRFLVDPPFRGSGGRRRLREWAQNLLVGAVASCRQDYPHPVLCSTTAMAW